VLATSCVVALCEKAAVAAIGDRLPPGMTTVGMRVQIDHLQPTAIGHDVRAEAVLRYIEGRKMIFAVSVDDDRGLVAAGKVIRVVVEIDSFMTKTV
jgi:predicted thioesterase